MLGGCGEGGGGAILIKEGPTLRFRDRPRDQTLRPLKTVHRLNPAA